MPPPKLAPDIRNAADAVTGPAPFWWQHGVVYQVYPRSFQDSNGDGVGDLRGIASRVDYLKELGVDAVWLSPIYPSPMADFGYDVADYRGIDPVFGSLQDFDALVEELHRRGLKLILDFVPNHSSSDHPWFVESCSGRSSPKRDWYVWRDPAPDGGPPNNWASEFGGSAWTFHEPTGQYYYHAYLPQQPDLNWRNPDVERAMHDVLRFWLDRGVDGFRVDAIHMLIEDASFADNPPNPSWQPGMSPARRLLRIHSSDRPETHDFIARMRGVVNEYEARVLIGEAYLPIDRLMLYYGKELGGFHLPFNFHLISTTFQPRAIAQLVREYEAALPLGGWPNWVLGNHDKSRVVTRLGGMNEARLAALLLLTLRGTPTIYNGEELGMRDVPIPPELVQDPWEKRVPGLGLGRDPCRTPFQWTTGAGAGFTRGKPWLPISADSATCNVESEMRDQGSMLNLYRELLRLRRAEPALSIGSYREIRVSDRSFVYERAIAERRLIIAMNFGATPCTVEVPQFSQLLFSSSGSSDGPRDGQGCSPALRPPNAPDSIELAAFEGVILRRLDAG